MLSSILIKVAGMEKKERGEYCPRPSLAGPERCIRQMVYWASGVHEDKAISDRFMMAIDDSAFHELLTADWLSKSAYSLHSSQMEVMTRVGMGHIDGIITDMLLVDRLYEHKAINHFAFDSYWKEKAYPLDYFTQCALYVESLRADLPLLDEAVLLIKNKNTAQYIDYVLHCENDTIHIREIEHSSGKIKKGDPYIATFRNLLSDAEAKFREVEKHKNEKSLPDRPFDMDDWRCLYCSWGRTCWDSFSKEYDALQEQIVLDEEVATIAKYYLETRFHIKEMNRQVRDMQNESQLLQKKILAIMKDKKTKNAKAGDYRIMTEMREKRVIDKEKIPEDILQKATRVTTYLSMRITQPQLERSENEFHQTENED